MSDPYRTMLRRAERAFPKGGVAAAVNAARTRAIIGPANIPVSEEAAQRAFDTLKAGKIPTPEDLASLEMLIRVMRPAPMSRDGQLEGLDLAGEDPLLEPALLEQWEEFRKAIKPFLYSVGRIDSGSKRIGTGFLIGPDLLVTNRHVVSVLSAGTDLIAPGAAVVAFNQEYGRADPPDATLPIDRVVAVHPYLDLALLAVKAPGRRPLDSVIREVTSGEPVAVIGYPEKDPERNPIFAEAVFKGRYGVKRAAVGEVMESAGPTFWHDCSTLGGNSGSPVLSLTEAKVIGVHFSGFFMYRNQAIRSQDLMEFASQAR